MCPGQCNVDLTVRDERVMRAMARDNPEVDDGWLCDKGRFAYQHVHVDERIVEPLVREGTELRPASWEKALAAAAGALGRAGGKAAALAAGETANEEAFLLQRLFRERLGSSHLSSAVGRELPAELRRALSAPALQARVSDLEFADSVLVLDCDPVDDAAIFDLRIRKGVRRHGVKVAVASARPSALDPSATAVLRYAPGGAEAFVAALDAAVGGDTGALGGAATAAGSNAQSVRELAEALTGEDIVIVYGERLLSGPRGEHAARALLNLAARLGLGGRDGAGLLEIPASANGRGLREAGFAPDHGPGYAPVEEPGLDATGIAEALERGELTTLHLHYADPLRSQPDRALWERALNGAQAVIAHDNLLNETLRRYATVVFPAEAYAEKEGTLVHPDGRLQRLRPAIGRPKGREELRRAKPTMEQVGHFAAGPGPRVAVAAGQFTAPGGGLDSSVRAGWQVLAELASRLGHDLGVLAGPMASKQLFDAVPFYAGLTLDEIGGRGVRWQERDVPFDVPAWEPAPLESPPTPAQLEEGVLRLAPYRSLWAVKEVDVSPALQFLRPPQVVELSPADAERLGIGEGDRVELSADDTAIEGAVKLRGSVPNGSVFAATGIADQPANALTGDLVRVRRIAAPPAPEPSAVPAVLTPAVEGLAEAPPSAPLDIPPISQDGR
jgi:NADH-quinone oxidoreductase subunit G